MFHVKQSKEYQPCQYPFPKNGNCNFYGYKKRFTWNMPRETFVVETDFY